MASRTLKSQRREQRQLSSVRSNSAPDPHVTKGTRYAHPNQALYSSPNGDRWLLCRDTDTERVFVRHEPNRPSGGQVSDLDVGILLRGGPQNPEHQAVLRLIRTLVNCGA
jgi:hypothetical protein